MKWLQKVHRQQEKELIHDGQHIQVRKAGREGRQKEEKVGGEMEDSAGEEVVGNKEREETLGFR